MAVGGSQSCGAAKLCVKMEAAEVKTVIMSMGELTKELFVVDFH